MNIQKYINIIRFCSLVVLITFYFFLPFILLTFAGWFNHIVGGIISDAYGLTGFLSLGVKYLLIPCSLMLFSYPMLETTLKKEGVIEEYKDKLKIFIAAPIMGYSFIVLTYFYGYMNDIIKVSGMEVIFTLSIVIVCAFLEIGAGVAIIPNKKLLFSEIAEDLKQKKSEPDKPKEAAPTNGKPPLAGRS